MTSLDDLLAERVDPGVRGLCTVDFTSEEHLATAVRLTSDHAIDVMLLPVVSADVLHLELHMFVDGEPATPETRYSNDSPNVLELTLRREE